MQKLRYPLALPLIIFLLALAAQVQAGGQKTPDLPHLQQDRYLRMADNFFILYDPSSSMDVPYKQSGLTRLEMEKKIIRESNQSLPELGWQAGLYPHWKGGLWLSGSPQAFKPYYRLQNYDKKKYGLAIDRLPTISTGPPMLQIGLIKLEHLLGLAGRTQVFLFTDGKDSRVDGVKEPAPLAQAKKLANRYDVCFTIISSAKEAKEQKLLADMAEVNSCSQVIDFDTVAEHPEHLLGKLYMDAENSFKNVLFDFDKYTLKKEYKKNLTKLGIFLKKNPQAYAVLSGFTDNIGTEAYNIKLSRRRAESVRNYLHNTFHINSRRLLPYWYGYANPVASNKTPQGRQLNRRVTIALRQGR
ncbi:MAG TPA: OmpA family protein [Desulfobulbus sp.]|nr:OmpA family protein [Desulfobulbus sp.]